MKTQILNLFRQLNKIAFVENTLVAQSLKGNNIARKIIGSEKLYLPGTLRTCTRNGINYTLDISDYVDHCIYFGFSDNTDIDRSYLKDIVRDGDIVFDIGANIGDTVLHFAKFLHNTGNVYAFEPLPNIYSRLEANVALNAYTNIKLNNFALGKGSSGIVFAHVDKNHSGGTYINPNDTTGVQIKVKLLDDFVSRNNITRINLIKIDTEGYEDNVLVGGIKTITTLKPALFIEINDEHLKRSGSSAPLLIKRLLDWGYSIIRTDNRDVVTEMYTFNHQHFDVLCLPGR